MDAKKLDTGPRDAINWLPDEILGKILSLLATKQAVSTSVLSKKWRTLFKLVDTLEFDDSVSGMGEQEASYVFPESFKDLVDRTVALQCDYPIRKLSLKCHVGRDDEQRKACVGRWISNVVGRGVSEVVLRINDRGLHFLSPQLLTCKTLVKLTLGTRLFLGKLPSYVSLPSLKFLFIHSVFFDDFGELSNVLLAGCPVVEALYLNQNGESMPYTISSPTLKRLSVHYEYHFESVISFDIDKEQEDFNKLLASQVLDPLRAMVAGSPLEDARHLAQRYSRMRQEAETHATEVSRRQARVREAPIPENVAKLQLAEAKMQELKANMAVLGKEATAALAAVESQQHRLTFQRLVAMVEGEKNYHLRIAAILSDIEAEMVTEKQHKESAPPAIPTENGSEKTSYFLAEVIHPFSAASEKELDLDKGDYIVVRKVSQTGWAEGECKGKAGWFPMAYIEKRQRLPTTNFAAEVY